MTIFKGKRIEIDFKCNENVPPEKTKPEFLKEQYHQNITSNNILNVAYFEVATSTVCVPRSISCEVSILSFFFNFKSLVIQ